MSAVVSDGERQAPGRLRQTHGDALRLVAYTAWGDTMARQIADAGLDGVIVKPASLDRILSAITA